LAFSDIEAQTLGLHNESMVDSRNALIEELLPVEVVSLDSVDAGAASCLGSIFAAIVVMVDKFCVVNTKT